MLNRLFTHLDAITDEFRVFKVQTIGDAYVMVSGLPYVDQITSDGFLAVNNNSTTPMPTAKTGSKLHLHDTTHSTTVNAAVLLNVAFEMLTKVKEVKDPSTGDSIEMRIGLHTGSIVAGVIGTMTLRYDCWGTDVLAANLMESNGIPSRIVLSETTAKALVSGGILCVCVSVPLCLCASVCLCVYCIGSSCCSCVVRLLRCQQEPIESLDLKEHIAVEVKGRSEPLQTYVVENESPPKELTDSVAAHVRFPASQPSRRASRMSIASAMQSVEGFTPRRASVTSMSHLSAGNASDDDDVGHVRPQTASGAGAGAAAGAGAGGWAAASGKSVGASGRRLSRGAESRAAVDIRRRMANAARGVAKDNKVVPM